MVQSVVKISNLEKESYQTVAVWSNLAGLRKSKSGRNWPRQVLSQHARGWQNYVEKNCKNGGASFSLQ